MVRFSIKNFNQSLELSLRLLEVKNILIKYSINPTSNVNEETNIFANPFDSTKISFNFLNKSLILSSLFSLI